MSEPRRADLPPAESLTAEQITMLLQAGRRSGNRHVAQLVQRLEEKDGAAWLHAALNEGPLRDVCALENIIAGEVGLDAIQRIKDASKKLVERGDDSQALAGATGAAGYYLAIAAALVHHDLLLSSGGVRELHDNLLQIAGSAPEPLAEFMAKAASHPRAKP